MFTVEEITAWSIDELITEIRVLLPPGVALTVDSQPGYFVVRLTNAEGSLVQEEVNPDQRLALLNIFGCLWSTPSVSDDSPWRRRREFPRRPIDMANRQDVPDPEDLNPDEVQSLYKQR
jgi:hypothetical protein